MSFPASLIGRMADTGVAGTTVCPVCRHTTRMQLFQIYDKLHVLHLPVAELNREHILLCPQCASVFSTDSACIQALINGNPSFLKEPYLTLVQCGCVEESPCSD